MGFVQARLLNCPRCKSEYDVSGYHPGKKFRCQKCGTLLLVPEGAPAAPPASKGPKAPVRRPSAESTMTAPPIGSARPPSSKPPSGKIAKHPSQKATVQSQAVRPPADRPMTRIARLAYSAPAIANQGGPSSGSLKGSGSGSGGKSATMLWISIASVVVVAIVVVVVVKNAKNTPQPTVNPIAAGHSSGDSGGTSTDTGTQTPLTGTDTGTPGGSDTGTGQTPTPPDHTGSGSSDGHKPDSIGKPLPPDGTSGDALHGGTDTPGGNSPGDDTPKEPLTKGEWDLDQSVLDQFLPVLHRAADMPTADKEAEIAKMVQLRAKAVAPLIEAVKDPDLFAAAMAAEALRAVTGDDSFVVPPNPSPDDQQALYDSWRNWWLGNQKRFNRLQQEREARAGIKEKVGQVQELLIHIANGTMSESRTAKFELEKMGVDAVAPMIEVLVEGTELARKTARETLEKWTEQDMGKYDEKEREEYAAKWRDWWKENKKSFKPPKVRSEDD